MANFKKKKPKYIWYSARIRIHYIHIFDMQDDRTIDDLSEEEYEDYQNNPDNYQEVTDNTNEMCNDMMYPNGRDDE